MRRCLTPAAVAVALSLSFPALAQDKSNCPPGSWFCEDVEVDTPQQPPQKPQQPDVSPQQPQQPQEQPQQPRRPRVVIVEQAPPPPPVVVYQPAPPPPPPHVIIVAPGYRRVPPPPPAPPPPRPRWHSEWGLNMRLEGVAFGRNNGASDAAGMGGIGLSLRYRPVPAFAIDAGIDLMAGTDYNGFQRTETPFSLSGILYVNPRSRVQFYLTGGMHLSHAEVKSDFQSPLLSLDGRGGYSAEYTYFGGQGGAGLEFRVSRRVALNLDGIGFMRKRTDENTRVPEFFDPQTGKTTNTSGGGIFRGGLTFWW